jgi:hypothetical protein
LRASRLASETAGGANSIGAAEARNQIQNQLNTFALQPEQIVGVVDLDGQSAARGLVTGTSDAQVNGLGVSLKKLNLKQVVDIGFEMQKISSNVKLAGIEITAGADDPHYFDVMYKLVAFGMPEAQEPAAGGAAPPPRSAPRPPRGPKGGAAPKDAGDDE